MPVGSKDSLRSLLLSLAERFDATLAGGEPQAVIGGSQRETDEERRPLPRLWRTGDDG